ncbi:MAG: AMP-binding protein [Spirochaetales bacterium]|jgi:long-chain acyl-CoA synthetase|nr:AMP-binding protein [Spirochaetales bacterium]
MTPRLTIASALTEAVRKFSGRPWLGRKTVSGWSFLSFLEVSEQARFFAAWLVRHGIAKGDRIALVSETSPEWLAAQLGIILAGAVGVPLSTRLLPAELRLRLDHAEPRLILVSQSQRGKTIALAGSLASPVSLICFDAPEDSPSNPPDSAQTQETAQEAENPREDDLIFSKCCEAGKQDFPSEELSRIEAGMSGDDEALISYTPGTEGPPKAVRISHANYLALDNDMFRMFKTPRMLHTMIVVPVNYCCIHPAGISFSLLRGIPLFFSDEPESLPHSRPLPLKLHYPNPVFFLAEPWVIEKLKRKIIRAVEKRGRCMKALFNLGIRAGTAYYGDGFNKTPFSVRFKAWLAYYLANRFVFALIRRSFGCRLRLFTGGAGSVSYMDQRFFHAMGIPVFQGYTLTETVPIISANISEAHKLGSSGRVSTGVACSILNSGGYPSGIGEAGEICVQGQVVMKGYFKNEEAEQNAIRDGWFYTGDMGYVDEDGFLFVTGRKSNLLVPQSGDRFSPEIIEEAIMSSSSIFRQVLVYNNRSRYSCALTVLDETRLAALAAKSSRGEILGEVTDAFYAFTRSPYWEKKIPASWKPLTFRILEEPFCEQKGTLNSAKKMVRERIIRSCQQILENMYAAGEDTPFNDANLEAVWRLTQKTLGVKV